MSGEGLFQMVKKINIWLGKLGINRDEAGLALAESIVSVAILGATIVTFVTALSAGSLAVRENDQEATVQSLARTQLEYTKSYTYNAGATTYPTVNVPAGYGISVAVTSVPGGDADIQKISANISRNGEVLMTIEDYKVNR